MRKECVFVSGLTALVGRFGWFKANKIVDGVERKGGGYVQKTRAINKAKKRKISLKSFILCHRHELGEG
jgi:hypothetical protein